MRFWFQALRLSPTNIYPPFGNGYGLSMLVPESPTFFVKFSAPLFNTTSTQWSKRFDWNLKGFLGYWRSDSASKLHLINSRNLSEEHFFQLWTTLRQKFPQVNATVSFVPFNWFAGMLFSLFNELYTEEEKTSSLPAPETVRPFSSLWFYKTMWRQSIVWLRRSRFDFFCWDDCCWWYSCVAVLFWSEWRVG